MIQTTKKQLRLLAIAPSSKGFGFAVLERETLVGWGVKTVEKEGKNNQSLAKVKALIVQYQPDVLVLQDCESSRRSPRIKALHRQIIKLAERQKLKVKSFSSKQVNRVFFVEGQGTKHERAQIVARRFPQELGHRLPPKRRQWESEDSRLNIFDAVALGLVFQVKKILTNSGYLK